MCNITHNGLFTVFISITLLHDVLVVSAGQLPSSGASWEWSQQCSPWNQTLKPILSFILIWYYCSYWNSGRYFGEVALAALLKITIPERCCGFDRCCARWRIRSLLPDSSFPLWTPSLHLEKISSSQQQQFQIDMKSKHLNFLHANVMWYSDRLILKRLSWCMGGLATSQFTRMPPKQDPPSHCSSAE